jgi:NADPH:quinone reductase-like Zn-dependent oxidoreductase/SAM-dependent methyltransferase
MVVEAAREMAIKDRPISGFRLKNITFSSPIVISAQEPRTEAQLYLRSTQDNYEKETTTSGFRLCVYENENWKEVCKGMVRVEYEQKNNEVDQGRERQQSFEHFKGILEKAARSCDRTVGKEKMYQTLRDLGLAYGPPFQGLQNLCWNGGQVAIGDIGSFDWAAQKTQHHVQPHLIHPATLDAVAQLAWVPLTKGATKKLPTSVPTRLRECWLASSGLGFPDPVALRGWTESSLLGPRGTQGIDSSAFALDQDGNLKLLVSHLESTTVSAFDNFSLTALLRQLCYNLEWKPDPLLLPHDEIVSVCRVDQLDLDEPIRYFDNLGLVLFPFILRALAEIEGEQQPTTKLHLQKHIAWMKHEVEKFHASDLPNGSPDWISRSEDTEGMNALIEEVENLNATGKLHVSIGRNLLGIIRGTVDPLELLFSNDLAASHYELVIDRGSYAANFERYLDILAHKNPGLRIIEIGAGTGAFTKHAIRPLLVHGDDELGTPRFAHYDYTDLSAGFFEKAKDKYTSQQQRMRFKILDIEQDPELQGFYIGTYDLVLAASVLHATRDLRRTIQNCRKLLKTGGKMIFLEIIQPNFLGTAFTFGTLPGWWLSSENFREQGPCVLKEQWDALLSENGFSGIDCLFQDYEHNSCHELAIMVTTAVSTQKFQQTTEALRTVLLLDLESPLQVDVAKHIRCQLQCERAEECLIVSLEEVLLVENPKSAFFIFLPEIEKPYINGLDTSNFRLLQHVASTARQLLWVTHVNTGVESSPELDMANGLARVLRSEDSNRTIITLSLECADVDLLAAAKTIVKVLTTNISAAPEDRETEYVERNGQILISRAFEAKMLDREIYEKRVPQPREQSLNEEKYLSLEIGTPGLLDSLYFVHDLEHSKTLGAEDIEVEVRCFGLQFRNVLIALGRMNEETIGSEFAGTVTRVGTNCDFFRVGDRVCAGITGTWKTYTRCNAQLAVKLPDGLTWEDAASFPISAITAYHSFVELAHLQKGESVLIHAGSGSTGQLAIQIAQHIGAEVFVTVGFDEKKQLLMNEYNIPDDHIFYSRDAAFAKGIIRMTNDRGVDVVLNSLSGESLIASWESIAPYGRFIEIGKRDIDTNSGLPMSSFSKNVTFSALAVDHIIRDRPSVIRKCLVTVMGMLEKKILVPARPLNRFSISEIQEAFRFMQGGRSSGKIVLSLKATDRVPVSHS